MGRLPFSGAEEVAHGLGGRLGYGVFGRQIVDQIAEEEGVSKTLVAGMDEHVESAIDRHVIDGFSRRKFTESDYLRDAVRIVSTLGMRGRTVVLGRGGASVLPQADTLRVLVVAPKEARQKRLAELDGISIDAAAERLEHADSQRAEFWRTNFNTDYLDPTSHDVVVNSESLGVAACVDVLAEAFSKKFES